MLNIRVIIFEDYATLLDDFYRCL